MQASFSISMTWGVAWTEEGEIPKICFAVFSTAFIFNAAALEANEPRTPKFCGPLNTFDNYEGSRNVSGRG